jgi:hypothetical protein
VKVGNKGLAQVSRDLARPADVSVWQSYHGFAGGGATDRLHCNYRRLRPGRLHPPAAPGSSVQAQLAEIAQRIGFDRLPEQTMNVARTLYFRLPDEVRLWLRSREFVAAWAERDRLAAALGW